MSNAIQFVFTSTMRINAVFHVESFVNVLSIVLCAFTINQGKFYGSTIFILHCFRRYKKYSFQMYTLISLYWEFDILDTNVLRE